MTPLQLQILIHYAYSAEDYRQGDFSATAVREAIDLFKQPVFPAGDSFDAIFNMFNATPSIFCNLLEPSTADRQQAGMCYQLSARGRMYVEALLKVPLPMLAWKMPEQKAA